MSRSSRYLAFFAYLLSALGALYVLLARRGDAFAVYHARQSLALAAAALAAPLAWAVVAWALLWVPLAGPVAAVALFALLIGVELGLGLAWVAGMVYALQGRVKVIPFVGRWAGRLPVSPPPAPARVAEPIETAAPDKMTR
jgi:uncharacterized membrane protein